MVQYTQAPRPLAVTTPLGEDAFLLVGLSGQEGMSRLFSTHPSMEDRIANLESVRGN